MSTTISRVAQQMKGYITKCTGKPIWQKLFFDHIIRDKEDYEKHIAYIRENPMRWYYEHLDKQKLEWGENIEFGYAQTRN